MGFYLTILDIRIFLECPCAQCVQEQEAISSAVCDLERMNSASLRVSSGLPVTSVRGSRSSHPLVKGVATGPAVPAAVPQRISLCIMHVCSFGSPALAEISAHISLSMTLGTQRIEQSLCFFLPGTNSQSCTQFQFPALDFTEAEPTDVIVHSSLGGRVLRTECLHFLWKQNKTKNITQNCQSTKGLHFIYLLSRSLLGLLCSFAFRAASQNMRFLR